MRKISIINSGVEQVTTLNNKEHYDLFAEQIKNCLEGHRDYVSICFTDKQKTVWLPKEFLKNSLIKFTEDDNK